MVLLLFAIKMKGGVFFSELCSLKCLLLECTDYNAYKQTLHATYGITILQQVDYLMYNKLHNSNLNHFFFSVSTHK